MGLRVCGYVTEYDRSLRMDSFFGRTRAPFQSPLFGDGLLPFFARTVMDALNTQSVCMDAEHVRLLHRVARL
jgi:hypothetical protein